MTRKIIKYWICLLLAFLALAAVFTSKANAATKFTSNDSFTIPECNSQIRFAAGGSYDGATLVGNAWVFGGLSFDAENLSGFSVSARDCNVIITGISGIYWVDQIGWVTYNVTGVGSQTFGLASLTGDGGWVNRYAVFIDGVNRTEGDGWTYTISAVPNWPYMASHYFTIAGATTNVSIGYTAIFNPAPLEPESTSQMISPMLTASSTLSSEDQPQGQVIYTVALIGVILAIAVVAFVVESLRQRIKR